jgi:hypothetical protein
MRLKVEVAETLPELFACRKPAPVPRVRFVVDAVPSHAVVAEKSVEVALAKMSLPEKVLLLESRVVDAPVRLACEI